ncbi:alkylation response protein AidB-like acyl-CoA dehydrogenase [Streptomyces achromogenes]|uniref:Alkylation response protein AidB-like acyl-CoA dehydrogenase n=1 Tax=Streptomyces achromogenes TaxID=67255 RepID=A0ABU0Q3Y5_STRAH|nr:acyl-CoA dehydrogenase family protein [Streptomyces achromogenes]MDQ0685373.1 alkylation response protein AidB-like acyl-CoA dehydrogenase [Streptomyces achromogenes]MDQ0832527.1 alkylation response protein AidB-like acyl-CoA dehydrogenase [Streptomyces achromogenes]
MSVATLSTLSTRDLSAAAGELAALSAEHAAAADATGRLSPDVVTALRASGFARHFVSARFGGAEGTVADFVRGVLRVSASCAATGWCVALLAASSRYAAHLPEQGHEKLWGSGADALIATGLVPAGTAEPAENGYRLSGRWQYISGVDFADWVLLCANVSEEDAGPRFFALPRGTFGVVQSWDCVGMRATGSHTVVVDDVFVPAHLSFARAEMETGVNSWSPLPAHNIPFQAIGATTFAAPAVGAAQGALAASLRVLKGKRLTEAVQIELVRATARIDSARHLVEQNAAVIDDRTFTPTFLARNQRNASFAGEQAAEAVTALVRVAGTAGLSGSGELQRVWRDVTTATSHVALRYDITRAAANYSTALIEQAI